MQLWHVISNLYLKETEQKMQTILLLPVQGEILPGWLCGKSKW